MSDNYYAELASIDKKKSADAANKLRLKSSKESIDVALEGLKSSYSHVRIHSISVIAFVHDKRVVEPLSEILIVDENEFVREQAAWALGIIGDVRAFDALKLALDDDSWDVRKMAIDSLGLIADVRCLTALKEISESDDEILSSCAKHAIKQIREKT